MASDQSEALEIQALLQAQKRSASWLAHESGLARASVHKWLYGTTTPGDPSVWARMKKVLVPPVLTVVSEPLAPYSPDPVLLKYAGDVPAGEWGDPLASEELHEAPPGFDPYKHFVTRAVGGSCYPAIQPHDVLIWRYDLSPPYGVIVLAQRKGDHGVTVKVLEWDADRNRPVLVAVDPDTEPLIDGEGWGAIAALVHVTRIVDGIERTWRVRNPSREGLRPKNLT